MRAICNVPKEVWVKDLNPGDAFEYDGRHYIVVDIDRSVMAHDVKTGVFVLSISTGLVIRWGDFEILVKPLPQLMIEAN